MTVEVEASCDSSFTDLLGRLLCKTVLSYLPKTRGVGAQAGIRGRLGSCFLIAS